MPDISLGLKGISDHIGFNQLGNNIEANIKEYFQYALLTIGGFTNINIPTSGIYGGDFSLLRSVDDPNYTDGQVWGSRKQWVYQTGTFYTNTTGGLNYPQGISVTVNGSPSSDYYVDYPNGQIVFNTPVSGTVKANYSYHNIQLYRIAEAPWWLEIQQDSYRVDNAQYLQGQSGMWSILTDNRVQLPAVIIESIPVGRSRGVALGDQTLEAVREVRFTILADNIIDRNNITDIFNLQTDRKLKMFDINDVGYPLNYRGELTGTQTYTDYLEDTPYIYHNMFLKESRIVQLKQIHPRLFITQVVTTVECMT